MERRNRPPQRRNNSPAPIILASIFLVVVAGIVGWLIFGYKGASTSTPTPSSTTAAVVTTAATATEPKATATPQPTVTATATQATTVATPPPATPTTQPTPTPAPTPTPIIGDYGELPSADIPSGTPGSQRLQLQYHLNMSLSEIPQTAPVYQMQPRNWSASDAQKLATSLGITGKLQDQGNGSFQASGNGDLYISNSLVQYIAPQAVSANGTPTANQPLPANDALVQTARNWLIQQNLLGAAIGPGAVINRDETRNVAQVQFKPVEPNQLLSAIPSANVTLDGAGNILEAYIRWPASMPRSNYGLRTAAQLWADASQGRGYIEIDDSALPAGSGALTGDATITSTSIAYTTAGAPETKQYLVPLVVFEGQATVSGAKAPIPIKIYVPAVGAQAAPRG